MSWSDRFVGIPFAPFGRDPSGCDCWGLIVLVYREVLGVTLPGYLGYGSVEEHAEIAALIAGATASPLWQPVAGAPDPFDVAVFRRGRLDSHTGLVLRPGLMLHMEGEDCAKVARYDTGRWNLRLTGHFRAVSSALEGPFANPGDGPIRGARP
jgi:probable lipoprotein NlpC